MSTTRPTRPFSRVLQTLTVAAWAYPFVFVGAFYLTYAIAWAALGHAPTPSLDDPKDINVWVSSAHNVTLVLMMGFPLAAIGGFFCTARFARLRGAGIGVRLLAGMLLLVVWIAVTLFLRWDPWRVGEWFMD